MRDKAIKRATAKYFSQLKKKKNPKAVLQQSAASFLVKHNSKLWWPKDEAWWDGECQARFDDLAFLAACWNIDLAKSPNNFADIYPEDCKAYFDMLAKKRFNTSTSETKPSSKKSKTKLEKAFEKRKAKSENSKKTDEDLMKEIVSDLAEVDSDVTVLASHWLVTNVSLILSSKHSSIPMGGCFFKACLRLKPILMKASSGWKLALSLSLSLC